MKTAREYLIAAEENLCWAIGTDELTDTEERAIMQAQRCLYAVLMATEPETALEDETEAERRREADIGANLPANYMDRFHKPRG